MEPTGDRPPACRIAKNLMKLKNLLPLGILAAVCAQAQQPLEPDPRLTPGDTFAVDSAQLCVQGYSRSVRYVPPELKRAVYAEYGIVHHLAGDYEIDHLIPLSLGGSNDIKNLWPESTRTAPWNSFVKDQLEAVLHELVCAGQLDLASAQREIATDWIAAYRRYIGPDPHSPSTARPGDVWVDTASGKFFRPDSQSFGRSYKGAYMPEAWARERGFVEYPSY
jgi:hypothetical protein